MPLVIYSNHASWWDPLVCLVLKNELFPQHAAYAPIDAHMLQRYRFFRKLGFFPVERRTQRGAFEFLQTAQQILQSPRNILALTPQNGFVDCRSRPLRFASGLGHLAARLEHASFVPLAIEYVFWEERLPEILVRFGSPLMVCGHARKLSDPRAWRAFFQEQLAETQNLLSLEAQRRRPEDFQMLLRGGAGQGGIYDLWRAFVAKWRNEHFSKQHGSK